MPHTRHIFITLIVMGLLAPAATASGGNPTKDQNGPVKTATAKAVTLHSFDALPDAPAPAPAEDRAAVPGTRGTASAWNVESDDAPEEGSRRAQAAPQLNPLTPSIFSSPARNHAGITTGSAPPDPIGDVGPDHYVQAVNVQVAMYLKSDTSGAPVSGPTALGTFFAPLGAPCSGNAGDPVVVYDQLAGRFVVAQFTGSSNDELCVGVSQTSNPTGSWNLYAFATGVFPDYFKIGVWPDGYYVTWNQGSAGIAVLERSQMLTGTPAEIVSTSVPGHLGANMMLPADADGATPPPAGSPGLVYHHVDGAIAGGADRLVLRSVVPGFNGAPTPISVSAPTAIPTTPFDGNFCGSTEFSLCVQQPGTAQRLDVIMEWPMWRFQYRNFGAHESLVGNFVTDVDATDRAGIRWFELRRTGGGAWSLFQEGTQSPDATDRWMGSIAMDGQGDIALGYSASDATSTFPSLWYAGRVADDPAGTLPRGEVQLVAGNFSQTASHGRWGDYASMNVDPVDDCTLWFTGEYGGSGVGQETRIGSFSLCGTVTVTKAGGGTGTVTTPDGKISCGTDCVEGYGTDTIPSLAAAAGPGSYFKGWSGGGCSGTGPCTPTKSANVTATFATVTKRSLVLKAKPGKVPPGAATKLILKDKSSIPGCDHAGDKVKFQKKDRRWRTFATKKLKANCSAKVRTVVQRTTKFRALVPQQDDDHVKSQRTVKVRVG